VKRRLVLAASAITVIVVAVLLWAWAVWLPNWRPALGQGERYGIDVSSHQDLIDWRRVAGDNIAFAYVKASEGGDFVDDRFADNWRSARDVGIDRGAYHFFTLCTPGEDQARHFLAVAAPDADALAPAVDLEMAGNCSTRPPRAALAKELDAFITVVEEAWGRPLVLYVGDDFEAAYPVRARLDRYLWHRRNLRRPDVDGWSIWQVQGWAKVDGIPGRVDLNVMRDQSG
jgi:lysozyme